MNVYGPCANRVMTAEVSGFQIHGFRGAKTALDAYFAALDVETGTFQPCGRSSARGSVIAHDPYRKMYNNYPGHDISSHEDFSSYTEFLELDSEYSELPALVSAMIYSDSVPPTLSAPFILPGMLGGAAGGFLLDRINVKWLKKIFALMVIWAGICFMK